MKALNALTLLLIATLPWHAQDTLPPRPDFLYARDHFTVSWYHGFDPGYRVEPQTGTFHAHSAASPVFYAQLAWLKNIDEHLALRWYGEAGAHGFVLGRNVADPDLDFPNRFLTEYLEHFGLGVDIIYRQRISPRLTVYGGGGLGLRWTSSMTWLMGYNPDINIRLETNSATQRGMLGSVGMAWRLPWHHQLSAELRGRYSLNPMFSGNYRYRLPAGQDPSTGTFTGNGHTLMLALGYHFTGVRSLEAISEAAALYQPASRKEIKKLLRKPKDWARPERGIYLQAALGRFSPRYTVTDPNGIFVVAGPWYYDPAIQAEVEVIYAYRKDIYFYLSASYFTTDLGYMIDPPFEVKDFPGIVTSHYPYSHPQYYSVHGTIGGQYIEPMRIEIGAGKRFKTPGGKYIGDIRAGAGVLVNESYTGTREKPYRVISTGQDTLIFTKGFAYEPWIVPLAHLALSRDWQIQPRLFLVTTLNARLGFVTQHRFTFDYEHIGPDPIPPAQARMDFRGTTYGFTVGLKYRIAGWNRNTTDQ